MCFLEGRFVNRFHQNLSIKPKMKVKACHHQIKYTPGNLTLNPTHEVLEDVSPFEMGDFQVPCSFSPRCIPMWVACTLGTNLPKHPNKDQLINFSSSPKVFVLTIEPSMSLKMRTLMYIDTSSFTKKPIFHGAAVAVLGTHPCSHPFSHGPFGTNGTELRGCLT